MNSKRKNLVFLHLPKTAGQSIHSFLVSSFGSHEICPARTMDQMSYLSLSFLRRFRIFSGHFDWDAVTSIHGNNYVFTILRDPFERILSFYFYLRAIGLNNNGNSGIFGADAAATLHPDDFFWNFPNKEVEDMCLNNFDNFYTFYFAARRFNSRMAFSEKRKNADSPIRFVALNLARENLSSLDLILPFNQVSKIPFELSKAFSECDGSTKLDEVNINRDFSRESRFRELKKLGASDWLFDILASYCSLDDELLREFTPEVEQTSAAKKTELGEITVRDENATSVVPTKPTVAIDLM